MKTCTKCGDTKDITEFHRAAAQPDGYRSNCKLCRLQHATDYRNSDAGKKVIADYNNSDAGKKVIADYWNSDAGKKVRDDYNNSDTGKKVRDDYNNSDAGKKVRDDYNNSDARKKARDDYEKNSRDAHKLTIRQLARNAERSKKGTLSRAEFCECCRILGRSYPSPDHLTRHHESYGKPGDYRYAEYVIYVCRPCHNVLDDTNDVDTRDLGADWRESALERWLEA